MIRQVLKKYFSTQRIQLQEYVDPSTISYSPPSQPEPISSTYDALSTDMTSVYGVINETCTDVTLLAKQESRIDALENVELRTLAVFKAKQAINAGYTFPILVKSRPAPDTEGTALVDPFSAFLARLKLDGGEKIVEYEHSILHVSSDRFDKINEDVKGLSLNEALLALKWHQSPSGDHYLTILQESIIKAKEAGLDLKHTYIAYSYATKSLAGFSEKFLKKYVRGVGRFGVSGNPIGCSVRLVLQERKVDFESRLNDPLEWMRNQLRASQKEYTQTAEEIYTAKRAARPIKEVHC